MQVTMSAATTPNCAVCGGKFRRAGGKKTCSDICREAYKLDAKNRKPVVRKYKLCVDKTDKLYILDRIVVNDQTGCWEWQKSLRPKTGYGQVGGYPHTAHRLSYMLWVGELGDLLVRHQCHNRICCNPDHLLAGTNLDNWHDSADVYLEMAASRRGLPAKNRVPVTLGGVTYDSKSEARKLLGVGGKALNRMIDSELRKAA